MLIQCIKGKKETDGAYKRIKMITKKTTEKQLCLHLLLCDYCNFAIVSAEMHQKDAQLLQGQNQSCLTDSNLSKAKIAFVAKRDIFRVKMQALARHWHGNH